MDEATDHARTARVHGRGPAGGAGETGHQAGERGRHEVPRQAHGSETDGAEGKRSRRLVIQPGGQGAGSGDGRRGEGTTPEHVEHADGSSQEHHPRDQEDRPGAAPSDHRPSDHRITS